MPSVSFSKLIGSLVSKGRPEVIYSYKTSNLVRYGSKGLSLVFFMYGVSFTDFTVSSASSILSSATEDQMASAMFMAKTVGPVALCLVPFALSAASLYVASRVITKVVYIPKLNATPTCQLYRNSMVLGREVKLTRSLKYISRPKKPRVFTGKGDQGMDDNGSFVFYLMDKHPDVKTRFQRYYLLSRSGQVWGSDGRIMDALFGRESIKELDLLEFQPEVKEGNLESSKTKKQRNVELEQDPTILEEMIKANSEKVKFHSSALDMSSSKIVNIVNSKKNKTSS
ncbi:Uncharacterized protein RNJ44_00401 [Nakaseomyces bracarensis]|uniref:Uncharacterized protein n=1 Tax=Nakaseomyces bracarensis TaxID=273131 RepID=A0ABR4NSN4_9SACH